MVMMSVLKPIENKRFNAQWQYDTDDDDVD